MAPAGKVLPFFWGRTQSCCYEQYDEDFCRVVVVHDACSVVSLGGWLRQWQDKAADSRGSEDGAGEDDGGDLQAGRDHDRGQL